MILLLAAKVLYMVATVPFYICAYLTYLNIQNLSINLKIYYKICELGTDYLSF